MNELETRYAESLDRADDKRLSIESASIAPGDDAWWAARHRALAAAHRELAQRHTEREIRRCVGERKERLQYPPEGEDAW